MKSFTLTIPQPDISYGVHFPSSHKDFLQVLKDQVSERRFLIITDENIASFYPEILQDKNICILAAGESSKSWESVQTILNACFKHKLDRSSVLVALGGGIVGDLTAFASSLYLRGISIVQCPTSLLAMVDAALGGKGGINTPFGKNLVGTITQPEGVIMNLAFLDKLPESEIKNGLCEMIKHGILASEKHFADLEDLSKTPFEDPEFLPLLKKLIPDSAAIKAAIITQDPFEKKERMYLNLGHTFGHALEKLSDFAMPHGQSVAIGCVMAAHYAQQKGLCESSTVQRIENLFQAFHIHTHCPYDEKEVWKAMVYDKKRKGNTLQLILPTRIGEVIIYPVAIEP